MKTIISISLATLLTIMLSFSPNQTSSDPKEKKATIVLLLDDFVCSEDQWVYLYGCKEWISGNERAMFDSAFIKKGQHRVELQANIPIECQPSVLFSKNGANFSLPIEPDSCVIMSVEETDGESVYYKKAIKGEFNNDYYTYWIERLAFRSKWQELISEDKKDSIEHLKTEWFNSSIARLKTAKLGRGIWNVIISLSVDFPERKKEIYSLAKIRAKKFPKHLMLQETVGNRARAPMSEDSKKIGDRLFELRENRDQFDSLDLSLGKKLEFTFPNAEGEKISTNSLGTDYTLVDFWASWCKPCRQETPTIKQALRKYPDKFDVYAVSLDKDQKAWQKAIKEDSTQMFKHQIGTYPNGQRTRLLRQLNIKAIPANFLIDKEHRIIAKDLRGERLIQILDSLTRR